jgi:hypothetical protein
VITEAGNFLLVEAPSHAIPSRSAALASVYERSGKWVVEMLVSPTLYPDEFSDLADLTRLAHRLSPNQRYTIIDIAGTYKDE